MEESGEGHGYTGGDEWFFYVLRGGSKCNGKKLAAGGYVFVPAKD